MVTVSLDDARADIAALLDRVEKGEDVLIKRRVDPVPRSTEELTMEDVLRPLDELRNSLPPWHKPSAEILRELRDERY